MYYTTFKYSSPDGKTQLTGEMSAYKYLNLEKTPDLEVEMSDGTEVPLNQCTVGERVVTHGNYTLHVARTNGWSTVQLSGEAAHLLDVLINEDAYLYGGISDFGTLLRNVNDPMRLTREVKAVEDLKDSIPDILGAQAHRTLGIVLNRIAELHPLASAQQGAKWKRLKEKIAKVETSELNSTIKAIKAEVNEYLGEDDSDEEI